MRAERFRLKLAQAAALVLLACAAARAETLSPGQSVTRRLSEGQALEYDFRGDRNTPLLFTVQRRGVAVDLEILDSDGIQHRRWNAIAVREEVAFTPQDDGAYRLVLVGRRKTGDVVLVLDYVSGPPAGRNRVVPLEPGASREGDLAEGSFDEYSFRGAPGAPVLITVQRQGVAADLEIFSPQGVRLKGFAAIPVTKEVPFTPTAAGAYRVRLTGRRRHGHYVIALSAP
jgi:hypothetical protein